MLVKAFTACHSSAEVYRTEAIESVFGPMDGLKPRTLAGLAHQMRTNLAGLWREPAEQEKKKTNRKKKDIEAEVLPRLRRRPRRDRGWAQEVPRPLGTACGPCRPLARRDELSPGAEQVVRLLEEAGRGLRRLPPRGRGLREGRAGAARGRTDHAACTSSGSRPPWAPSTSA